MNKRSKRYTDEFKMLILELLEDGRKNHQEMNMGQQRQQSENGKKNLKESQIKNTMLTKL